VQIDQRHEVRPGTVLELMGQRKAKRHGYRKPGHRNPHQPACGVARRGAQQARHDRDDKDAAGHRQQGGADAGEVVTRQQEARDQQRGTDHTGRMHHAGEQPRSRHQTARGNRQYLEQRPEHRLQHQTGGEAMQRGHRMRVPTARKGRIGVDQQQQRAGNAEQRRAEEEAQRYRQRRCVAHFQHGGARQA